MKRAKYIAWLFLLSITVLSAQDAGLSEQLKQATTLIEQSRIRDAIPVLEKLEDEATVKNAQDHLFSARIKLIGAYLEMDQIPMALSLIKETVEQSQKRQFSPEQIGQLIMAQADGAVFSRDLQGSMKHIERAITWFDSIGAPTDATIARLRAGALHQYMRNLPISDSVIAANIHLLQPVDRRTALALVKSYINIADRWRGMDLDSATHYYLLAEEISRKHLPSHDAVNGMIYNKLGISYKSQKKVTTALQYYLQSRDNWKNWFGEVHPRIGSVTYNIGTLYQSKGEYESAARYMREAIKLDSTFFGPNHRNTAQSYAGLGNALKWLQEFDQAAYYLKRSTDIRSEAFGPEHPTTASSLVNLGNVYEREDKYDLTLEYFRKARSIWEKHPDDYGFAKALVNHNIANVLSKQGNYDLALKTHRKGFYYINPNIDTTDYYSAIKLSELPTEGNSYIYIGQNAVSYLRKFRVTKGEQDLNASLEMYKLFFEYMERLKAGLADTESKLSAIEYVYDQYGKAVETAYLGYSNFQDAKYLDLAFYFMEAGKSLLLMENLYDEVESDLPTAILEEERKLIQRISSIENKIYLADQNSTSHNDSVGVWRSTLANLKVEQDQFVDNLRVNHANYFELKYDHQYLSIDQFQNEVLEENELFLHYLISNDQLYIMAVDQENISFEQIENVDDLDDQISQIRQSITKLNTDVKDFANDANGLYDLLIRPIQDRIQDRNLIISPTGLLSMVPFEVLFDWENNETVNSYADIPYLITTHAISYSYNATIMSGSKAIQDRDTRGLLAFAPSFGNESDAPAILYAENAPTRDELVNLRGSVDEVVALKSLFGGQGFTGNQALESTFKKMAPSRQIIHLATHGVINEKNPGLSYLAFSDGDETEDGSLYAWELALLDLKADLGVLSACNTGMGEIRYGEGVMSIGRAFSFAGCPSLLMSLWPVNDLSTADIMKTFYSGIKSGQPKDVALRQAKLNYLNDQSESLAHPLFWAGFVLQGNTNPITLRSATSWTSWLPAIFLSLIIAYFILTYFRKSKNKLVSR